jgi:peptide/nickel transport system permease protein
MGRYILKRLLLLPFTLFLILLLNFVILNLAPGDPTTATQATSEGASRKGNESSSSPLLDRHLIFREHYGLNLPIMFNTWSFSSTQDVKKAIEKMVAFEGGNHAISGKEFQAERLSLLDRSRYMMHQLFELINDPHLSLADRKWAVNLAIRGGLLFHGADTQTMNKNNFFLINLIPKKTDDLEAVDKKVKELNEWYQKVVKERKFEPTNSQKVKTFFFETRFWRYLSRVLTLDFGSLRNDVNRKVIDEVFQRIPISLTIAGVPMILTFFLCQIIGFWAAYRDGRWEEQILNLLLLILFAIPVFVAAPFLIEWIGIKWNLPIHGFSSPERIYRNLTTWQKLKDISYHLILPFAAILYGSLATQSRLTKHLVQEISHQEYIRTARAKGLGEWTIAWKHVGRNLAIVLVTSLAGSLGVLLGGSLIVETLFEINGFGRFFYEAILNRDFNVILFSSIVGSFLTLLGYLLADLTYVLLDPRVRFT